MFFFFYLISLMCAHWNKIEIFFSLLEIKMALYTVIVRCYFTSIIQHFWKALSISSTYIRIYNFFIMLLLFSVLFSASERKTSVVVCYPFFYLFSLLRFLFTLWKMEWKKIFMSVRCFCFNWFLGWRGEKNWKSLFSHCHKRLNWQFCFRLNLKRLV